MHHVPLMGHRSRGHQFGLAPPRARVVLVPTPHPVRALATESLSGRPPSWVNPSSTSRGPTCPLGKTWQHPKVIHYLVGAGAAQPR
jgi:hypothetical protein